MRNWASPIRWVPWRFADWSLKVLPKFGKMKGLWRAHWILAMILEKIRRGETDLAAAWCVQGSRCIYQVALDRGVWSTASLLLPEQDPLVADSSGGTLEELMAAHAWQSATAELKKIRPQGDKNSDEEGGGKASKSGKGST